MVDEARFYKLGLEVVNEGDAQVRFSKLGFEVVRTIADLYSPTFTDDGDFFSDLSYFTGFRFPIIGIGDDFVGRPNFVLDSQEPDTSVEWNPYRPDVPSQIATSDPDTYDFMRHQAETQREQHNLTQAGDTTFPWEKMFKTSDSKAYSLGSLTRFSHPIYGIMLARYVQFSEKWTGSQQAPVYWDTRYDPWIVTDDPSKSNWSQLVGVSLPYDSEVGSKFGWVLVQGRGLSDLVVQADSKPGDFKQFTGSSMIGLALVGPGKKLGVVLDSVYVSEVFQDNDDSFSPQQWRMQSGAWAADLEGVTEEYIRGLAQQEMAALSDRVTALESAPTVEQVDYSTQIATLQGSVNGIQNGLTNEITVRYNRDNSLESRIDEIAGLIDTGDGTNLSDFFTLKDRVTALEDVQVPRISNLESSIASLSSTVSGLSADQTSLQSQISALTAIFGVVPSASVLTTTIQDTVAALLVEGSNVTLTYDSVSDPRSLTIDSAGGGGGGGGSGSQFLGLTGHSSAASTSAHASKGNVFTAPPKDFNITGVTLGGAAGNTGTYSCTVALVNSSNVITSILVQTSSISPVDNWLRFFFDVAIIPANSLVAVILTRTDGTATSVCQVNFPSNGTGLNDFFPIVTAFTANLLAPAPGDSLTPGAGAVMYMGIVGYF